eukprot:TRINITY_DN36268_c0_g3_i1.p1 TRINITY_DN36268_c0_g3~~TRINITY_DN36268_c0_g3_i1.p1  ORF type:complete len:262 (-),score=-19.72 TRINITY_DN36268_c0_g3_i1:17-802(-)
MQAGAWWDIVHSPTVVVQEPSFPHKLHEPQNLSNVAAMADLMNECHACAIYTRHRPDLSLPQFLSALWLSLSTHCHRMAVLVALTRATHRRNLPRTAEYGMVVLLQRAWMGGPTSHGSSLESRERTMRSTPYTSVSQLRTGAAASDKSTSAWPSFTCSAENVSRAPASLVRISATGRESSGPDSAPGLGDTEDVEPAPAAEAADPLALLVAAAAAGGATCCGGTKGMRSASVTLSPTSRRPNTSASTSDELQPCGYGRRGR